MDDGFYVVGAFALLIVLGTVLTTNQLKYSGGGNAHHSVTLHRSHKNKNVKKNMKRIKKNKKKNGILKIKFK